MKNHLGGILLFGVMLVVIPFVSLNNGEIQEKRPSEEQTSATASVPLNTQEENENPAHTWNGVPSSSSQEEKRAVGTVTEPKTYKLYDLERGTTFQVTPEELVRGALAAEMPPTFHPEALKAQAVAAHTYALSQMHMQAQSPDPALKGAAMTADPAQWKSYTTEALFRERYGTLADAYWKAICQAAEGVSPYVITYEQEPIMAAYHSMSAGITEDAANVWQGAAPYLVPVESRGDILAPDYETKAVFTKEQMVKTLKGVNPSIVLENDPAGWFVVGERSQGGYVLTLTVGNEPFTGKEIRSLLDLRSAAFDVAYSNESFTFTVRGYGHGVGFSQYGADYLARQGKNFEEILAHYYPGTTLALVVPEGKVDK